MAAATTAAPGPRQRIQTTWSRRVTAEYRSAALTAELLHWLIVIAASPDTIEACGRIVSDEMEHAERSRGVFLSAGGDPSSIQLPRADLSLWHAPDAPLEYRTLAAVTDLFCCGESVAVPLFLAIRDHTTQPGARDALGRILRDEARHRVFGWQTLDELLDRLGDPARAWLHPRIPVFLDRLVSAYSSDDDTCAPEERAWGRMAPSRYGTVCRECVDEVLIPRFRARGLWV